MSKGVSTRTYVRKVRVSSTPTRLLTYCAPLAAYQGVVYLQPSEARVRAGATVPLLAAHNGAEMAFTLEEDKLTRKGSDCELLPPPCAPPPPIGAPPYICYLRAQPGGRSAKW